MPTFSWTPNAEQRQAVEHGAGPLRIQAGAGSGKTTTLAHRIGSLVERGLCRSDQILVLTFTTKAVADLRRKVGQGPRVETYHAFALALVREFAERLGLAPDPVLLTEAPLKLLIRQQIDRLGIEQQDLTRLGAVVEKVVGFAGWHRHEGSYREEPGALLERLGPDDDRALYAELLRVYGDYRALLREKNVLDYDELIALAVGLLEGHPDVRADVTARYPFLLVDEYQDTDFLQGEMVRLLAGEAGNVTIVGDPDQTIYSFRGAAMTNIRAFHTAWPDVVDVAMVTNYRSTPEILAGANLVIARNQRRKAELLVAARESGMRPQLVEAPDWPAEARWLAAQVLELRAQGVPLSDMAILLRRNKDKAGIHAALVEAGIPVQVVGGIDLFDDPEAVRCTGYIRALAAPHNDEALTVALSMPRYGLSDHEVALVARRRQEREALLGTVGRLAAEDARLQAFLDEFWPLYRLQFTEGCEAAVRQAIALHAGGLAPETRAGVEQLLDLAGSFFARPDLFTGAAEEGGLALFAEYLEGLRTVGDPMEAVQFEDGQEAVKLLTMHAAKGLEFPVLFLPRLAVSDRGGSKKWDKPFPLAWHHDREFVANAAAMLEEEERRLFYVAVTRAMDRLYLSWAPLDPDRVKPLRRSPFVDEMAEACDLRQVGEAEAEAAATGGGGGLAAVVDGLVSGAAVPPVVAGEPLAGPEPVLPAVLSFSHLSTYQLCPFRFYLQYLLGLPGRPNRAADAGVRLHAAIEKLAATEGASFAEFAGWAESAPSLKAFWESEYAQTPPIASEQEFFLRMGGAVLRGFIDRIHPLPDGSVEVVDFKNYSRLMSEAEVKAGLQLPLYLLACREALGHREARCGALFFLKHGTVVRVQYTDEELAEARRQAEELVAAIGRRDWAPSPGQKVCGFCPYRDGCPVAH